MASAQGIRNGDDKHSSDHIEPRALVTIAYRKRARRRVTFIAGFGSGVCLALVIILESWWLGLISVLAFWGIGLATSIAAARRVERLTGLTRSQQSWFLVRYKTDSAFASKINRMLKEGELAVAIDEASRQVADRQG